MTNNNDVIDLTDSFTLTDYFSMGNISVIELDDSVNDKNNTPAPKSRPSRAKKTSKKLNELQSPKKVKKPKKKQKSAGFGNCPICLDALGTNAMASTKCGHVYCIKCLEQSLKRERRCPTCRCVLKGTSAYHPLYLTPSHSDVYFDQDLIVLC